MMVFKPLDEDSSLDSEDEYPSAQVVKCQSPTTTVFLKYAVVLLTGWSQLDKHLILLGSNHLPSRVQYTCICYCTTKPWFHTLFSFLYQQWNNWRDTVWHSFRNDSRWLDQCFMKPNKIYFSGSLEQWFNLIWKLFPFPFCTDLGRSIFKLFQVSSEVTLACAHPAAPQIFEGWHEWQMYCTLCTQAKVILGMFSLIFL